MNRVDSIEKSSDANCLYQAFRRTFEAFSSAIVVHQCNEITLYRCISTTFPLKKTFNQKNIRIKCVLLLPQEGSELDLPRVQTTVRRQIAEIFPTIC